MTLDQDMDSAAISGRRVNEQQAAVGDVPPQRSRDLTPARSLRPHVFLSWMPGRSWPL